MYPMTHMHDSRNTTKKKKLTLSLFLAVTFHLLFLVNRLLSVLLSVNNFRSKTPDDENTKQQQAVTTCTQHLKVQLKHWLQTLTLQPLCELRSINECFADSVARHVVSLALSPRRYGPPGQRSATNVLPETASIPQPVFVGLKGEPPTLLAPVSSIRRAAHKFVTCNHRNSIFFFNF